MSQGFVNQFGSAFTYSGSGLVIPLQQSPTINQPNLVGTTTNNDAPAGSVGELISSIIASGSAVAINSSTATNLTSISLTAGDWDVWANITINSTNSNGTAALGQISTVSATLNDASLYGLISVGLTGALGQTSPPVPTRRFSLSSTTTIYLTGFAAFATGAGTMTGGIYARRVR